MLVLICGDRHWGDYRCEVCQGWVWPCTGCMVTNIRLRDRIKSEIIHLGLDPDDDVIMHGAAKGADTLAGEVAERMGFKVVRFPADWNKYGKKAGPLRNRQMLDEKPDLVLAFHPDLAKSKGTKDMVARAKAAGIVVRHFTGDEDEVEDGLVY